MGIKPQTLGAIVDALEQQDDDAAIFVDPQVELSADTAAAVGPQGHAEFRGMRYLLEIWLAREAIDVWRSWRGSRLPTLEEKVAAVVYYALNDAYMPI